MVSPEIDFKYGCLASQKMKEEQNFNIVPKFVEFFTYLEKPLRI